MYRALSYAPNISVSGGSLPKQNRIYVKSILSLSAYLSYNESIIKQNYIAKGTILPPHIHDCTCPELGVFGSTSAGGAPVDHVHEMWNLP